jgi:hypothetical protein
MDWGHNFHEGQGLFRIKHDLSVMVFKRHRTTGWFIKNLRSL